MVQGDWGNVEQGKDEKWIAIFNKVAIRVGLIEKMAFEQTLEGTQCAFQAEGISSAEALREDCVWHV